MVMYEFIRSLKEDIGKDVRIQFYDERGDYAMDGKIHDIVGDNRVLIFERNPIEAEKLNSTYAKINLEAVVIRGVDLLDMPTFDKLKQIKAESGAQIPCPKCGNPIYVVVPELMVAKKEEEE